MYWLFLAMGYLHLILLSVYLAVLPIHGLYLWFKGRRRASKFSLEDLGTFAWMALCECGIARMARVEEGSAIRLRPQDIELFNGKTPYYLTPLKAVLPDLGLMLAVPLVALLGMAILIKRGLRWWRSTKTVDPSL